MRSPCSLRSCPAKAWYVEMLGSPLRARAAPGSGSGSRPPALTSTFRARSASSPAALLVKVRPSTWSGATWPVPTSQTTRAAITVVLPEPAPATITCGAGGAVMHAVCSGVNGIPSSSLSSSGSVMRADTPVRLSVATDTTERPGTSGGQGRQGGDKTDKRPHPPSLHHVASLRAGAARGAERAALAVRPGARREALVEDASGRGGEQFADPLPVGRVLRLDLGRGVAAILLGGALPQLDQFGAAGFGAAVLEETVDGPLAHGELIDGQLGVVCDLAAGHRLLAGLEVDDV